MSTRIAYIAREAQEIANGCSELRSSAMRRKRRENHANG
jgi:hypothetical protein